MPSSHPTGPPTEPINGQPSDQPLASAVDAPSTTPPHPQTGRQPASASSSAHAPPIPSDLASDGPPPPPPRVPIKPALRTMSLSKAVQTSLEDVFDKCRKLKRAVDDVIAQFKADLVSTTPTTQARLGALLGRRTVGRPLSVHGWESLIVPLIGLSLLLTLLYPLLSALWSKAYNLHVAARIRLLQRQHTLAVTPSLLASLRTLSSPPRVAPPKRVYKALYALCAAEAPHGPAYRCEAGVSRLIESPGAFQVHDAAASVRAVVDVATARVEEEYARAKRMEIELGVMNASSKPFHAVMLGLDQTIVAAVRAIHANVAQTVSQFEEFREREVKEAVLNKLRADRERIESQAKQGIMADTGEVMVALDEVIEALAAWKAELDEAARWWAGVHELLKGEDESGGMWWVPRHLWGLVRDVPQDRAHEGSVAGLADRSAEL